MERDRTKEMEHTLETALEDRQTDRQTDLMTDKCVSIDGAIKRQRETRRQAVYKKRGQ